MCLCVLSINLPLSGSRNHKNSFWSVNAPKPAGTEKQQNF